MSEKEKIIIVSIVVAFIALVVGVTYAWFNVDVSGNGNTMTVTTAELSIEYRDGNEIARSNWFPGVSVTKIFEVENTGTDTVFYDLQMVVSENTFENNELVYTLTSETGANISETPVPLSTDTIVSTIAIPYQATHTYELTIIFKEMSTNQNQNQRKNFTGTIEIDSSYRYTAGGQTVEGQVVDIEGNGVEGALVTFFSTPKSTTTGSNGYYKVRGLSAGEHTVEVTYEGLIKRKNINLVAGGLGTISDSTINTKEDKAYVNIVLDEEINIVKSSEITIVVTGGTSDKQKITYVGVNNPVIITASSGYILSGAAVTCDNGITHNYNTNTLIITSAINDGVCRIVLSGVVEEFAYIIPTTSNPNPYYEYPIPADGYYEIELWGAQGATNYIASTSGKGAYTRGKIYFEKNEKVYIYIGSQGHDGSIDTVPPFNGGGRGGGQGGGATDIRLQSGNWDNLSSLKSRIMVAGGGGGPVHSNSQSYIKASDTPGDGGTLFGIDANFNAKDPCYSVGYGYSGQGGTQTSGGEPGILFHSSTGTDPFKTPSMTGKFAIGGYSIPNDSHQLYESSGGGGGYYGGGHGVHPGCTWSGGGGGSSYISGYAGVNSIQNNEGLVHSNNTIHYSGKYFVDGQMEPGIKEGHGQARITFIGSNVEKNNTELENVRYIKDCINNNSENTGNSWNEIQAIKDGINVAKNKELVGNLFYNSNAVVDGIINIKKQGSSISHIAIYNNSPTRRIMFSNSSIAAGDKIYFEVDAYTSNITGYSIDFNDIYITNNTIVSYVSNGNYYKIYGSFDVTDNMLAVRYNNDYPNMRFIDINFPTTTNSISNIRVTKNPSIIVDLESTYDLDEIAVWNDWSNGKTYNSNITSVSTDGEQWTTVKNTTEAETSNGKRVNAYSSD